MLEFFRGWRRILGCALLVIPLSLAVAYGSGLLVSLKFDWPVIVAVFAAPSAYLILSKPRKRGGVFTIREVQSFMLTSRQKAVLSHLFNTHQYDLLTKILSLSFSSPSLPDQPTTAADCLLSSVLIGVMSHVSSLKERQANGGSTADEPPLRDACYLTVWVETGTRGIPEAVAKEYLSDKCADPKFIAYLDQLGMK